MRAALAIFFMSASLLCGASLRWVMFSDSHWAYGSNTNYAGGDPTNEFVFIRTNFAPAFCWMIGDVVELTNKVAEWQTIATNLGCPFYAVSGNHDVGIARLKSDWTNNWSYWNKSITNGNYKFIGWNSAVTESNNMSAPIGTNYVYNGDWDTISQLSWLSNQLDSNYTCILFQHFGINNSDLDHTAWDRGGTEITNLCSLYSVPFLFHGHYHDKGLLTYTNGATKSMVVGSLMNGYGIAVDGTNSIGVFDVCDLSGTNLTIRQYCSTLSNYTLVKSNFYIVPQYNDTIGIYYVATNGNDTNSGSMAAPWRTVQHAADTMTAGQKAIVSDGIYSEAVRTVRDGTSASRIEFIAASTNASISSFDATNSWNVLNGFTLTGSNVAANGTSVRALAGGHSLAVISNIFLTPTATSDLNFWQNYTAGATNCTVAWNQFWNCFATAVTLGGVGPNTVASNTFNGTNGGDALRVLGSNNRVLQNLFTNWVNLITNANHTDLIQSFGDLADTATNNLIGENLAVNCNPGCQVGNITDDGNTRKISDWIWRNNGFVNVGDVMSVFAPDFKFYNNSFYRTGTNSANPLVFRNHATIGTASNTVLYNNIFMECGEDSASASKGWYSFEAGLTGCESNNNLVIGTGAGTTKTGFTEPNGVNGSDPRFVSAATGNLRLSAGSPCIGAATNLNALFTTDKDGVTRGSVWDIGAYEFQSGVSRTANAVNAFAGRIIQP